MKRFWIEARAVDDGIGWHIELDRRPLKTPARALLVAPNEALALAIVSEWNGAGEIVEPKAMPLTALANAAIDGVAADAASFAADVARYGEADLLCYRAEAPAALVGRQAEKWDPLLAWARLRYDVEFIVTRGIIHVVQPAATVARLSQAVVALDHFQLTGLSPLVTIGGSLIAALALLEKAVSLDEAWRAVSLDEQWQLDRWGADAEAAAALANRESDFAAAHRFLTLLA